MALEHLGGALTVVDVEAVGPVGQAIAAVGGTLTWSVVGSTTLIDVTLPAGATLSFPGATPAIVITYATVPAFTLLLGAAPFPTVIEPPPPGAVPGAQNRLVLATGGNAVPYVPDIPARIVAGYGQCFRRGDCNDDGSRQVSDPIFLLAYLFQNGPRPDCKAACDTNDDGDLNLADATHLLEVIFIPGTPPPPPPFPGCGRDIGSNCTTFASCGGGCP
jgi:hypothetical protein